VREAAELQAVPYAFARSIQHDLVLAGLITSQRGAYGGMKLACNLDTLTLKELVEAVQGPISVSVCTTEKGWCNREKHCQFHRVWEGANKLLRDYLESINVRDLLAGKQAHLVRHPSCKQA
jgi:Rrf2 family protein